MLCCLRSKLETFLLLKKRKLFPRNVNSEFSHPSSAGNADSSAGNADSSAGNADSSAGNADSSAGNADSSAGNADSSAGNADSSAGNADSSAGNADSSAGNADSSAGNADTCTVIVNILPLNFNDHISVLRSFYIFLSDKTMKICLSVCVS